MTNFLSQIIDRKKEDVAALYAQGGIQRFMDDPGFEQSRPSFLEALTLPGLSLIAEIKKASPSKGIIRDDFDPLQLADQFQQNAAVALSVLTEPHYFQGSVDILRSVHQQSLLPLLRKDFIIDPIQIYEAKAIGASAILLIAAILSDAQKRELFQCADALELDVLYEVHTAEELAGVADLEGCQIVGINNRNLTTFEVDVDLAQRLVNHMDLFDSGDYVFVAESGYTTKAEMQILEDVGFDGVLIGEGLAKYPQLASYFSRKRIRKHRL